MCMYVRMIDLFVSLRVHAGMHMELYIHVFSCHNSTEIFSHSFSNIGHSLMAHVPATINHGPATV